MTDLMRSEHRVREMNPLKADIVLKKLLHESKSINTTEAFDEWKIAFLDRYEKYLDQNGLTNATNFYLDFIDYIEFFSFEVANLTKAVEKGQVTPQRVSVRGRNSINEAKRACTEAMQAIVEWLPTKREEERKLGYSKWQLGAVLVRDGFEVYETMALCSKMLNSVVEECLTHVADSQTLEIIGSYQRQIQRFCDVMSDLGLYELMMISHKSRSQEWIEGKRKDMNEGVQRKEETTRRLTSDRITPLTAAQTAELMFSELDDLSEDSSDGSFVNDGKSESTSITSPEDDSKGETDYHQSHEIRMRFSSPAVDTYEKKLKNDNCIVVPELFGEEDDFENYHEILSQIEELQKKRAKRVEWVKAFDAAHFICNNPSRSKLVDSIVSRVCSYFKIEQDSVDVKLLWYKDGEAIHPSHNDEAAVDPDSAEKTNIVVFTTFGAEREMKFTAQGVSKVTSPLTNNGVFAVGNDVNLHFERELTKANPEPKCNSGNLAVVIRGITHSYSHDD